MRLGDLQEIGEGVVRFRIVGEPVFGHTAVEEKAGPELRRVEGAGSRFLQQV